MKKTPNNFIKPEIKVIKGGQKVIFINLKETRAVNVLFLVKTGADYEDEKINGLSHFLEHMFFKGTKKRPQAKIISTLLDGLGASYNAFTDRENTGYYIKIGREHLATAIDVLTDIYLDSLFDSKEIEKEKGVIVEEMNLYEDTPSQQVYDIFRHLLYGNQPIGRDILGQRDFIQKATRNDFINYLQQYYTQDKTLIIVSGSFDKKEATEILEKKLTHLRTKIGEGKKAPTINLEKKVVAIKEKKTDQAHIILGAQAFDIFDERRYALHLLSNILGEGMSSRLWQKIREEMGAAYYVSSFADLNSDYGFFGVSAGVAIDKIEKVIQVIKKELIILSEKSVSTAELKKAKDNFRGHFSTGLETSGQYANFYGFQYLYYQRFFSPEEIIKKIEAVRASQIKKLARELFSSKKLRLAIIGPFSKKDEERFSRIVLS